MKSIARFMQKFPMNYLLPVLVAGAILVACSTPRYTYYFSRYSANSAAAAKLKDVTDATSDTTIVTVEAPFNSSSCPVTNETLITSTSNEPLLLGNNLAKPVIKSTDITSLTMTKSGSKGMLKKLRPLKKIKVTAPDGIKEGDQKKNGFAIVGTIFSIFSVGLAALIFLDLGVSLLAVPLAIVGIIFSSIGLKSEKRGLARAGLIIGILGQILLIVGLASLGLFGGYD